jgi:hypothetical protein
LSVTLPKYVALNQSGLTDVTYTLLDGNRNVIQSALGTGIGEVAAGSAVYGGLLSFPVGAYQGFVSWNSPTSGETKVDSFALEYPVGSTPTTTDNPPPVGLRPGMADLITRLRRLIGDPTTPKGVAEVNSSAAPVWGDLELQDALDVHREVVRYAPLEPRGTPRPNSGVIDYLDYYATAGQWDTDTALFGPAWQPLSPATADFLTGHWTFSVSQIPTCFVVGRRYDTYGAAADVCEEWAAKIKLEFSFRTPEGGQFTRKEQSDNLMALAASYRAKQEASVIDQVRPDTVPGGWGTL